VEENEEVKVFKHGKLELSLLDEKETIKDLDERLQGLREQRFPSLEKQHK
jgi:hypothetical protein